MPYKLSWYLPKRIILVDCVGTITTDEIRSFAQNGVEMVTSGRPLVHFIVDFRQVQGVESIPQALRTLQQNPPHPDTGWVLFVGKLNPLLTTFADFAGTVIRVRYRRFGSMEEALAFLKERDTSLALV